MLRRLRIRLALSVLAACVLSALGGGLTVILPSSALVPAQTASAKHTKAKKRESKKTPAHRVAVRRGPAGPAGPQGSVGPAGPSGQAGPAGPQIALSLQVDWHGLQQAYGHDSSSATLPGIGTLTATCNTTTQTLTLTPSNGAERTVLDATVFKGEGTEGVSSNERLYSESTAPVTLALPPNGMVTATISVEPIAGGGEQLAAPASLTLSSEFKPKQQSEEEDDCYIAAQIIQQQ